MFGYPSCHSTEPGTDNRRRWSIGKWEVGLLTGHKRQFQLRQATLVVISKTAPRIDSGISRYATFWGRGNSPISKCPDSPRNIALSSYLILNTNPSFPNPLLMQDSTRIRRYKKYISPKKAWFPYILLSMRPLFPKEGQRERHLLGDGIFDSWKEIGGGWGPVMRENGGLYKLHAVVGSGDNLNI